MNQRFVYFESTDGGMEETVFADGNGLGWLYGWMHPDCRAQDQALVDWINQAEVGDIFRHRLGTAVRLKDFE